MRERGEKGIKGVKDIRVFYEIKEKKDRSSVRFIPKEEQVISDIKKPCYIFLDQSTFSGYAVYDSKNQLITSGEVQKKNTSLEEYKYTFKDIIYALVDEYEVSTIFYEEVYDEANMWTTEVLMYIKHMIKDIGYLRKDVEVFGVDHTKWKRMLAAPEKFSAKKGKHKDEVKKYVEGVYPLLFMDVKYGKLTENMIDAIGMGVGLLVKQSRRGGFYNTVRYNKNLPIHEKVMATQVSEDWDEIIRKSNKPYRDAYGVGGVMELELDRRRAVGDLFRRYLTHRDGVAYVRIPKDYKDWGVLLLKHNIKPSDLGEQQDFLLLAVRKKRK